MQSVLNFEKKDIPKIKKFLSAFEKKENVTPYQVFRAKIGKSTITLFTSGKLVIQGTDHEKIKQRLLLAFSLKEDLIIGVDEVGRGEGFGPFVVAGVLGDKNKLRELRDSKKTKKIEEKFLTATENSLANVCVSLNAEFLDKLRKKGINLNKIESITVRKIAELFEELQQKDKVIVDGGVAFLDKKNIEFEVKADDTNAVVGAASVIAKFQREKSGDKKKRKTWGK